jgi:hypothetical protein
MEPDVNDMRSLGVAISHLWIDEHEVSLKDQLLFQGWYVPEPGWRWTNGDAWLAAAGARVLAFEVGLTGSYWLKPQRKDVRVA